MVPELERHCGSWVMTAPSGLIRESFDRDAVEIFAAHGWRVETAAAYLGRVNAEIRSAEKQRSDVPDDDRR